METKVMFNGKYILLEIKTIKQERQYKAFVTLPNGKELSWCDYKEEDAVEGLIDYPIHSNNYKGVLRNSGMSDLL